MFPMLIVNYFESFVISAMERGETSSGCHDKSLCFLVARSCCLLPLLQPNGGLIFS